MRHRIRAAAIVVEGDSILLVQHQHDDISGGQSWWVPPGGGVEGEESLFECAKRETLEETGLSVELDRIAYIREFVEPGYHHCEVFLVADSYSGTLVTGNNPGTGVFDVDHIIKGREVRPQGRDGRDDHLPRGDQDITLGRPG